MGNCGCNCVSNNIDIIIPNNSDVISTTSLNTDISSQVHSKISRISIFDNSHISSKHFYLNNVSEKISSTSCTLKRKGPILVKLQKKRNNI